MHVIGTAGHVDHGKSTLVKAMTGINPDRLREEQEREMTIDLGFAWLTLPDGEPMAIVDVPGHRDFIENMLAGVGGIDAALFVIAADEGVMPQTREHLAILDLLEIPSGVVALTKTDAVDDPDWIDLVTADVEEVLNGTVLEAAPIVPVSARTGKGLQDLIQALEKVLAVTPTRPDLGRPRLWIDRVFTISGFGTVVTGTLLDGSFEIGQEVEILPQGTKARVRGLQTHKEKLQRAVPGSRVAINLSGVSRNDIVRGNLVTAPGWLQPTVLVDVQLEYLEDAPQPLKHNTALKFFCGSAESMARVRLLGQETQPQGVTGWAQFQLSEPLPLLRGDRFIVRLPSPPTTVGGGKVVDPNPGRKHRRFRPEVIARLETLAQGTPADVLLQALERRGPQMVRDVLKESGLEKAAAEALNELLTVGNAILLSASREMVDNHLVVSKGWWSTTRGRMRDSLEDYHSRNPLKPGMGREELRSLLRLPPRTFNGFMERVTSEGLLADEGATVRLPEHEVRFSPEQQQAVDKLLKQFRREPYRTPSAKESAAAVGEGILAVLISRGELVAVSSDVLFLSDTFPEMVTGVRAHIQEQGSITLAQARDLFNTSRKYAQALLEHLDGTGITKRVEDERVLA